MMILSFIVGSLISLVGRIGGDAMSLVSFIMSEENFQNNNNPLLLNEIGDAKKYLHRCIQGDGDIAQELGLGDSLDSFEEINSVENNIVSVRDSFTQVIERLETYNRIDNLLTRQSSHTEDINMIKFPENGDLPIKYNELEDSRDSTLKSKIDTIVTYAINSNDIKTSTSAASVKFVIDALKVKYDKYLHRVAYNILYNTEDSDECVNDTYLKAWNSIPPTRPAVLKLFLAKITRNLALDRKDYNNAQKRGNGEYITPVEEIEETLGGDNLSDLIDEITLKDIINSFLEELPKETRIIFVKRYWLMDPISKIAKDLNCGESKIKMSLSRTREKLRKRLEKEGYNT
jgi:RNA polymerase sigma-70 factor (ECF subfamily)